MALAQSHAGRAELIRADAKRGPATLDEMVLEDLGTSRGSPRIP